METSYYHLGSGNLYSSCVYVERLRSISYLHLLDLSYDGVVESMKTTIAPANSVGELDIQNDKYHLLGCFANSGHECNMANFRSH